MNVPFTLWKNRSDSSCEHSSLSIGGELSYGIKNHLEDDILKIKLIICDIISLDIKNDSKVV